MAEVHEAFVENVGHRTVMRLSAILDTPVRDVRGKKIGDAHDFLAVPNGPEMDGYGKALTLHTILAGAGAFGDRLGYERGDVKGPWLLDRIFSYLHHRNAVAFTWDDIAKIEPGCIRLSATAASLQRAHEVIKGETPDGAIFLALGLLDRQILDRSGHMSGNVDDLELSLPASTGTPYVSAILSGPGALSHRIGGRLGLWIESVHSRLHPREGGPARIGFEHVKRIASHIELDMRKDELELDRFEEWVRDRIITRIPGSG